MSEEAVLLYSENRKDADGFPVALTEEKPVFVRKKSATRTEFYEAVRAGMAVTVVFEVRLEDWEQTKHITSNRKAAYASQIRYDDAVYDIVRVYAPDKSMVELMCK